MGRSQGVVFGYGAIVPTQEFVNVFPGTFKHDDGQWKPKKNNISNIETTIAKIFYSEIENADYVFIATSSSVNYNFEKGYIYTQYKNINLEEINNQAAILGPWLLKQFPNSNIGYLMYGYYVQ